MKQVFRVLDLHKEKKYTIFIIVLTILMTLVETVGISLIMPFIQIAMDFETVHSNKYYQMVYTFFDFTSEQKFVLVFGVSLLVFFMLRVIFTIYYKYNISTFSKRLYRLTVQKMFSNYVGLSYRQFIEHNSSRMTQMIAQEAHSSESLVRTVIFAIGDVLTIAVVYVLLLTIDWKITLVFTTILAINVTILSYTVSPVVKRKGAERTEVYRYLFKMLNETFGNFKMIKLRSSEEAFGKSFSQLMKKLTRIMVVNETLQQIPRLFLEFISFSLIIGIVMYWILEYNTNIAGLMGILSVFFFAIYRLMPAFNNVISSINQMINLQKSLNLIRDNLLYDNEKLGDISLTFKKEIRLENISFEYLENKPVLNNISLNIEKGEHIAFIGPSGSGKSTIVDLIIGLYQPSDGEVLIDTVKLEESNLRSLRKKVGYIPQDIYLFDATVAENVALGSKDEIDEKRVIEVLKQAHIYDFLNEHQEGLETIVGDKGVKLSGGQKQRIAIARALYYNPEILVLDEATSALDTKTEEEIMNNIYEAGSDKTLIIIAHRLSTVKRCNKVYTIDNGHIVNIEEQH